MSDSWAFWSLGFFYGSPVTDQPNKTGDAGDRYQFKEDHAVVNYRSIIGPEKQ
ncbi:MAG: hypothetical protein KGS09_18935 [Nitrospirae bacterium]|nr:hypothetical protein [Nitrospirota bacterium]MDE3219801.1 hypothetical protein [Nitrospirota bacterium]